MCPRKKIIFTILLIVRTPKWKNTPSLKLIKWTQVKIKIPNLSLSTKNNHFKYKPTHLIPTLKQATQSNYILTLSNGNYFDQEPNIGFFIYPISLNQSFKLNQTIYDLHLRSLILRIFVQ